MNVIINFICMGYAELWATRGKRKIENENIVGIYDMSALIMTADSVNCKIAEIQLSLCM